MKIQTKQVIDVSDFDKLVEETYGKPYNFQQQDDCKERGTYAFSVPTDWDDDFENDSVPDKINGSEMGVSFKAWLARDVEEWNGAPEDFFMCKSLFWSRNWYPNFQTVANDLHAKGLLPVGEYVINIDW
jgi:hypothetical protein